MSIHGVAKGVEKYKPEQQAVGGNAQENARKAKTDSPGEEPKDTYIPEEEQSGPNQVYKRPKGVDSQTIDRLKSESDQAFSQLKEIVRLLLERQGLSFQELVGAEDISASVEVDDEAILAAQALIGEGGALSPEAVSDRLVGAAIAFAGEDMGRFGLMRLAIEAGFEAAAKAFGGTLPEISYKTYDLIVEKLDAYEAERRGEG